MTDFSEEKLEEMLKNIHSRSAPYTFRVKKGYKAKTMNKKIFIRVAAAALSVVLVFTAVVFSRQIFGAENSFVIYANAEVLPSENTGAATADELAPGKTVELKDALDWQSISYGWDHIRASLAFKINVEGENVDTITYTAHGAPFLIKNECEFLIKNGYGEIVDSVPFEAEDVYQEGYGGYAAQRTVLVGYDEFSSYTVSYNNQPAITYSESGDEWEENLEYPVGLEILWLGEEGDATLEELRTLSIKAQKLELIDREKAGEEIDPLEYNIFDEYSDEKYDVEWQEGLSDTLTAQYQKLIRDKYADIINGITVDVTANYKNGKSETKTVKIGTSYDDDAFITEIVYTIELV